MAASVNVALAGALGRMGQAVAAAAEGRPGLRELGRDQRVRGGAPLELLVARLEVGEALRGRAVRRLRLVAPPASGRSKRAASSTPGRPSSAA